MNKRENIFCSVNQYFFVFVVLLSVGMFLYYGYQKNYYFCALSIVSPFYFLLPFVMQKVFRVTMLEQLKFVIYSFCFLAYTIGTAMGVYRRVENYDKLMHTLSGVLFAFLGLLLFYFLKQERKLQKQDYKLVAAFSFSFSMTIAAMWEIYEYILDFFTGMDAQMVQLTGINDTMQDILVCFIGTIIFEISIYFYYKRGKKSLLMGICDTMFAERKSD